MYKTKVKKKTTTKKKVIKKVPAGYHMMKNGTLMKGSKHKGKK
jgi:hypothetical protein